MLLKKLRWASAHRSYCMHPQPTCQGKLSNGQSRSRKQVVLPSGRTFRPTVERFHRKSDSRVKYMPGAGSTKGANWFQRQKDGDGTAAGSSGSTQFPYLLDDPRVVMSTTMETVMASGTGGVAYPTQKTENSLTVPPIN